MPVESLHPGYVKLQDDWQLMRDAYAGEATVKARGPKYLAPTPGMLLDGFPGIEQKGTIAYNAYRMRAIYHDYVGPAIEAMLGLLHSKPPTIELPSRLQPLIERAAVNGESLQVLLWRIHEAQLLTGRIGLMLDVPSGRGPGALPYIATYNAEAIINWDDGSRGEPVEQTLNLVVLNETESVRHGMFDWKERRQYRVLTLGDPLQNEVQGAYVQQVFTDVGMKSLAAGEEVRPSLGGRTLPFIPFVFINSNDVVSDPDDPPLISLARIALGIYRGEADYRQSLFNQSQDTLVVSGRLWDDKEEALRVGAGAVIRMADEKGKAEFVGVKSSGIPEQRHALAALHERAESMSGQLVLSRVSNAESGEALRIRVAARTSSLTQIAHVAAEGLQQVLRMAAIWVGADPEEVHITPNLEFSSEVASGQDVNQLQMAKLAGAVISARTIHGFVRKRGITDLSFEEELQALEEEEAQALGTRAGGDPVDDDPEPAADPVGGE